MAIFSRTCNVCNELMTGGIDGFIAHGDEHHPGYFLSGTSGKSKIAFLEKKYWCPLDNRWYATRKYLARAIKAHGWSNEQFFLEYGEQYMPDEWQQNHNDPKYGDSLARNTCLCCGKPVKFQEMKWQYPIFCGFSCSTKWHAENTDRVEKAMATLEERKKDDPTLQLRPNQIEYWTRQGLCEEAAREKVAERQRTNSLERFIERYGQEEGMERYAKRQEKWLESMKESGMFSGVSNVSMELFSKLGEHVDGILYGNNEVVVRLKDRSVKVDCIHREKRKVIEFYGDYWHGNPKLYEADHVIQKAMTAAEKWEKDRVRNKALREAGFDVLIIWESEYAENPDLVLGKCIGFMTSGMTSTRRAA